MAQRNKVKVKTIFTDKCARHGSSTPYVGPHTNIISKEPYQYMSAKKHKEYLENTPGN